MIFKQFSKEQKVQGLILCILVIGMLLAAMILFGNIYNVHQEEVPEEEAIPVINITARPIAIQLSAEPIQTVEPILNHKVQPKQPAKIPATMPKSFVDATELIPNLVVDLRYAGKDNFLGRPAAGYLRNDVAVMKPKTAELLAKAQKILNGQGLGIYIFDAYRPQQAVDDFQAWIKLPDDPAIKEKYYPTLKKSQLPGKYLARHSLHSKGIAVDISIVNLETGELLDMGTIYPFFGGKGIYAAKGLTDEQRANRKLLHDTMVKAGFKGIPQEWWHFQLKNKSGKYYNFPIQ